MSLESLVSQASNYAILSGQIVGELDGEIEFS